MKIKSIITTGLVALALISGANAQSILTTNLAQGASTNLFLTNAVYITGVTVTSGANTAGTNVLINLYDASTATNQIVLAAYTNMISFKTNFISVITNSLGLLQTNKYAGLWTTNNAVAAITNTLAPVYTVNLPPNSSGGNSSGLRILVTKGLSCTQNAGASNATVTVFYTPFP